MAAIIPISTDDTVINHEVFRLDESQKKIEEKAREIIQAIWLNHVEKVKELLQHTPSLLNTEFSANIYKISVPEGWEYNLDDYHFIFPDNKPILTTPKPSVQRVESWNLQHLVCYKKNLALAVMIHQLRPNLFFYCPQYSYSVLKVLSKDNSLEAQNFLRNWLNLGSFDNHLFHRSSSLNLTYHMTDNGNIECIKLIFQRALTLFSVQVEEQLMLTPILYPQPIANLISSYLSFNDCPRIQENINSVIYHTENDNNFPAPLLYFAMLNLNFNERGSEMLRFLVDCGADPNQLIDKDSVSHISRFSLRYNFSEKHQEKIQSILKECGKGEHDPHSIKPENAIIVSKPLGKLKRRCLLITEALLGACVTRFIPIRVLRARP